MPLGTEAIGYFLLSLDLMTQFQIEAGGLVQGVTKLITILLTSVTLNKNYAN